MKVLFRQSGEIVVTVLIALVSLILSGYVAYSHNDKQIEHRLSVVETQVQGEQQNLDHVRSQVDKLVDYLMGSK